MVSDLSGLSSRREKSSPSMVAKISGSEIDAGGHGFGSAPHIVVQLQKGVWWAVPHRFPRSGRDPLVDLLKCA